MSLLFLAACATTTTSTITETTAVTKTLLVSQRIGRFQDAVAISTDQFGNTYVVDRGGPSVIKYSQAGDSLGVISGFGREQYQFDMPADIDARLTNSILIADHNNHRVERYTRDFAYSATVERRQEDQEQLRFGYPAQVAADDAGNFYLIDGENKRVLRVNASLKLERVIGGYANSTNPTGTLVNPTRLTVDGDQNLIVYDAGTQSLHAYDPLGSIIRKRSVPRGVHGVVQAIAARNDTVFVLDNSARGPLHLYHSPSLVPIGSWQVFGTDEQTVVDVDVRDGVTLLTQREVLKAGISVSADSTR